MELTGHCLPTCTFAWAEASHRFPPPLKKTRPFLCMTNKTDLTSDVFFRCFCVKTLDLFILDGQAFQSLYRLLKQNFKYNSILNYLQLIYHCIAASRFHVVYTLGNTSFKCFIQFKLKNDDYLLLFL